jgi:hypothetical protein
MLFKQRTTNNGLGFVRSRFGVGNQFLVFAISFLHVTRHAEEGVEEGRGKILEF